MASGRPRPDRRFLDVPQRKPARNPRTKSSITSMGVPSSRLSGACNKHHWGGVYRSSSSGSLAMFTAIQHSLLWFPAVCVHARLILLLVCRSGGRRLLNLMHTSGRKSIETPGYTPCCGNEFAFKTAPTSAQNFFQNFSAGKPRASLDKCHVFSPNTTIPDICFGVSGNFV